MLGKSSPISSCGKMPAFPTSLLFRSSACWRVRYPFSGSIFAIDGKLGNDMPLTVGLKGFAKSITGIR